MGDVTLQNLVSTSLMKVAACPKLPSPELISDRKIRSPSGTSMVGVPQKGKSATLRRGAKNEALQKRRLNAVAKATEVYGNAGR